jgi:hypothetical protein
MLRNRTYRGEIVHKGQSHPSEHPPIIDQPLRDAVQMRLVGHTAERNSGTRTPTACGQRPCGKWNSGLLPTSVT